jgi:Na+-transporting NADH:ubiquinone oxidoreductase subunit C
MQRRDTFWFTVGVAVVLCVVCSCAVSIAVVVLRPQQEMNKTLDRQRNILDATGLALGEFGRPAGELSSKEVADLYGWIDEKLVDLQTGEYTTDIDVAAYDSKAAAKIESQSVEIKNTEYNIGKLRREKIARVYFVKRPDSGKIQQIVLPVYGQGLWSTLYGYLAVKSDLSTVQGLTFYEHAETPGLGGEVDNPAWKSQWEGRQIYGPDGEPKAEVFKGTAPKDNPYAVDGLSGATITSRGVTNLIRYWASDDGYGIYLDKLKQELTSEPKTSGEK